MTYQATTIPSARQSVRAELDTGTVIHLWLKSRRPGEVATMSVELDGIELQQVATARTEEFEFCKVALPRGGSLELSYDAKATDVSVIYAFLPTRVQNEGIRVLHHSAENAPPALSDGYHFRPLFGWMNDPNGFGRFGGQVHLFYQHYPHSLRWNTMHWGHAVSNDYVHWRHLPVFLFPSDDLSQRNDGRGGAFSGSAIAATGQGGDDIRVFYTEQVRDRKPEEQIQLSATSLDGLSAEPSTVILPERPGGLDLTLDFRDPYVFKGPDGRWKMLIGSRDKAGGVVLLYETLDPVGADGWTFLGTLHRENRYGMTAAECPCMVPLGDAGTSETRWALIFGLLTSRDQRGRRNMTSVTVGRFDGQSFTPELEQELDFGSDAYAFQAFVDDGGPVGIAWLANWTDVSKKEDFPTAMTLPRRVLWDGTAVLTPPVEGVNALRHAELDGTGRLAAGERLPLENGAVEIELDLSSPGAAFELRFDHTDIDLALRLDAEGLEILFGERGGKASPRYLAAGARPSTVRVFLDAGSIEVFADNGRWTGTKRLPTFMGVKAAQLSQGNGSIASARVWQLKL
ncbi:beta-fructofuranosidase [Rhizobium sp. AC44/96]|uniref:GH32 C-terminal domain-containing protein n=1 Tax=Rhizobium sp. AC44/96 TaxID=1841654 RepID=UPI00080F75FC|nr:glycoside hydrolase family 32 protein [Rhizobium sp. AC44/96]OCJ09399.1 beta-fructofuranosidase [Rhizobium sp. AC44/96]